MHGSTPLEKLNYVLHHIAVPLILPFAVVLLQDHLLNKVVRRAQSCQS